MENKTRIDIFLHELAVEFRKLLNKNEARKRG